MTESIVNNIAWNHLIEVKAAENDVTFDAAGEQYVRDTVEQTIQNVVGDGGTEAQLNEKLQSYYMDLDLFKYFTKVQYLYNALAEKLFGADGASITDDDVQEFAEANSYTTAKHILLKTIDDSGKAIADDEKAAKKQKADNIAAQLKAVADPQQRAELFDELMAEYNEDTGENSYPHGYCFTSGSMVTEFEDACKTLEPYEVSGVVESKYGYHIILRMPTQGDDLVMSSNGTSQTLRQLVAQQQLGSLVSSAPSIMRPCSPRRRASGAGWTSSTGSINKPRPPAQKKAVPCFPHENRGRLIFFDIFFRRTGGERLRGFLHRAGQRTARTMSRVMSPRLRAPHIYIASVSSARSFST